MTWCHPQSGSSALGRITPERFLEPSPKLSRLFAKTSGIFMYIYYSSVLHKNLMLGWWPEVSAMLSKHRRRLSSLFIFCPDGCFNWHLCQSKGNSLKVNLVPVSFLHQSVIVFTWNHLNWVHSCSNEPSSKCT